MSFRKQSAKGDLKEMLIPVSAEIMQQPRPEFQTGSITMLSKDGRVLHRNSDIRIAGPEVPAERLPFLVLLKGAGS